jgi:hypothetical protein
MGGRKTERGPGVCARCKTFHAGTCKEMIADEVEASLRKLDDPNERVHVLIACLLEYAELTADPDEAIRKLHGYIDEIWDEHAEARAQRLAQRGIQRRALSS